MNIPQEALDAIQAVDLGHLEESRIRGFGEFHSPIAVWNVVDTLVGDVGVDQIPVDLLPKFYGLARIAEVSLQSAAVQRKFGGSVREGLLSASDLIERRYQGVGRMHDPEARASMEYNQMRDAARLCLKAGGLTGNGMYASMAIELLTHAEEVVGLPESDRGFAPFERLLAVRDTSPQGTRVLIEAAAEAKRVTTGDRQATVYEWLATELLRRGDWHSGVKEVREFARAHTLGKVATKALKQVFGMFLGPLQRWTYAIGKEIHGWDDNEFWLTEYNKRLGLKRG